MNFTLDHVFALVQPFAMGLAVWAFVSLVLSMFPFMYGLRSSSYINAFAAYLFMTFFWYKASAIGSDWSLVFASERMKSAIVFGFVGWSAAWGLDWAQKKFPLMPRWGFFFQFIVIGISILFLLAALFKHFPV